MPNDPFSHCPAITNFDNDLTEKIKAELTWLSLGRRVISQVGDFMTVLLAWWEGLVVIFLIYVRLFNWEDVREMVSWFLYSIRALELKKLKSFRALKFPSLTALKLQRPKLPTSALKLFEWYFLWIIKEIHICVCTTIPKIPTVLLFDMFVFSSYFVKKIIES